MTVLGSLLATMAWLLRDVAQLAVSPSASWALTALAAAVLAGAVFATILALLASVVSSRIAVPAALVEIVVGALAGNIPGIGEHVTQTDVITFLAAVGSLVAVTRGSPGSNSWPAWRRRCR